MPNTVSSYCAVLLELLLLMLGVDITLAPFRKLSRTLFHLQIAYALPEPAWSLDQVLSFLLYGLLWPLRSSLWKALFFIF